MIECDFCGCHTPKPGKGLAALLNGEPARIDEPGVLIYFPPCAAACSVQARRRSRVRLHL